MGREADYSSESAGSLGEGSELGGLILGRLLCRDGFSSLWMTEPLEAGRPESCVRVIPASHFRSPDAYERFCADLAFWKGLSSGVVELYECSRSGEHYFAVMRYMSEGSVADQLGRDEWLRGHVAEFAFDFAAALCEVHSASGAHGNLKPSNVFPVRGKGVLLSDFTIPLWVDEFEKGCSALARRLLHPYRAPEQMDSLRDFDTRSDVYSFGLILLWCLSGIEPTAEGQLPELGAVQWPSGLGTVVERCLSRERERRPADGLELLDAIGKVSGLSRRPVREEAEVPAGPPVRGYVAEQAVLSPLGQAQVLVDEGSLAEALSILEPLPREEEVSKLLNEIQERRRACEELAREAVRLAGMDQMEAAADAIKEAERLWPKSETVMAVKAELAGGAQKKEAAPSGGIPQSLRASLDAGKYATARALLEKLIREASFTEHTEQAIKEFKKGRVRQAFLENTNSAKRLYIQGHWKESKEHWLEAARWLPPGAHRERLRRIAGFAGAGKLRVAVEEALPVEVTERSHPAARESGSAAAEAPSRPSAWPGKEALLEWWPLLVILGGVVLFLVAGLVLLRVLRGG